MIPFIGLLILLVEIVLIQQTVGFFIAVWRKDNSIADIFWGLGFALMVWLTAHMTYLYNFRQMVVLTLVLMWGFRLAGHIIMRSWGKGEDKRYLAWRKDWGKWWVVKSYLWVFVLQGLLLTVIALPAARTVYYGGTPQVLLSDQLGFLIWMIGFFFEVVGDWQLYNFKKDPKNSGKVYTKGLWRFTRHPNYFGEAMQWWGIYLLSLGVVGNSWLIVSPLLITFLLLKVSGVKMTEKRYRGNKQYKEYKQKTSAFLPWFPKK